METDRRDSSGLRQAGGHILRLQLANIAGEAKAMLKKIVKIHNVGRLHRADAQGDQEFRSLTLIFGENGRGKTTLCEVLRSLKTGDPDILIGRRTLAQPLEPEAELRFDSGNVSFAHGAWTEIHPEIEIFDTTFVHENVYAGDIVEHEHKRNLFRVIVGEQGVALARRVDEIDIEMRDADRDINTTRATVADLAPAGMTADQFVALEVDPEVERKIRDAQAKLRAAQSSDEIRQKSQLSTLELPSFPPEFTAVLSKGLDDISAEVERTVKDHIESHTAGGTEQWVEEGLGYVEGDRCPFCAQSLTAVAIVESFSSYFSEAYRGLKEEAANLETRIAAMGSEASLLGFDRDAAANDDLAQFWTRFVEGDSPSFDLRRQPVPSTCRTSQSSLAVPGDPIDRSVLSEDRAFFVTGTT